MLDEKHRNITFEERKLAVYEMLANYDTSSRYSHHFIPDSKNSEKVNTQLQSNNKITKIKIREVTTTSDKTKKEGWLFRTEDIEKEGICPYKSPNKKGYLYLGTDDELLEFSKFKYYKLGDKRKHRTRIETVVRLKKDLLTLKRLIVKFYEGDTAHVRISLGENSEMAKFNKPFQVSDYWRDNQDLVDQLINEINTTLTKIAQNEKVDARGIIFSDMDLFTYSILYYYCKDREGFLHALLRAMPLSDNLYTNLKTKEVIEITLKSISIGEEFKYRFESRHRYKKTRRSKE